MAKRGRRQIVVDGVTYYWRARGDDHYGTRVEAVIVDADQTRPPMRVAIPHVLFPLHERHWWEVADGPSTITPRMIERAIRKRRGREDQPLDGQELLEVLGIADDLARDYLIRASQTLGKDVDGFARAFVGAGCTNVEPARVDDWIASHGHELAAWRPALQSYVDGIATEHARYAYQRRSAVAFFVAACERVSFDAKLDTTIVDARLATIDRFGRLPWGIPAGHWWWVTI